MVCLSGVQPFFSGRVDQTRDSGGNRTYTYAKSFPVSNGRIFFELLQITLHLRTYSVLNVLVVLVLLPTQRSDHFLCILCIKYNIREDFRVSVCPSQFCFPFLFRRSGFFTGRHFEIGIPGNPAKI